MKPDAGMRLVIRDAGPDDCDEVLEWRNDETARKMSGTRDLVSREEHSQWFTSRLANPDCRMYIAVGDSGARLGVVRFDRLASDTAEVSINIAPRWRGKGLGRRLLSLGVDTYLGRHPNIDVLVATISEENVASDRIFTIAGFSNRKAAENAGFFILSYARPRPVSYVLLANGAVALRFLEHVAARRQAPVLVVLNGRQKQRMADEIRSEAIANDIRTVEWSPETKTELLRMAAENRNLWLLSVYFGHVVPADVLAVFGGRSVNLHPSLLPWSRGVHTNVWPLLENSPAGVTLHVMTPRVDTGAILLQVEVAVEPCDTAETLYAKLEQAALKLLVECWPDQVCAAFPGREQPAGGSEHHLNDLRVTDEYDLDAHPEALAFFNQLRARSFPPHPGLRLSIGGAIINAAISLSKADPGLSE